MKPQEIEDQIKGLLGLNLGGVAPGSLPVAGGPGGGPRPGTRNPGPGSIRPPGPGARGPPRPRHASPAPFGPRGGARPHFLWDMNNAKCCNGFSIEFRQNLAKETFSYDEHLKS